MDDIVRIETSLTIQFELEEEIMDAKSQPLAEGVPPPAQVPEQDDAQENQAAQQQQDSRTDKEKKDDDNAIYYVIEQMMKKEREETQQKEDEEENKKIKEEPVEEQKIKIEPQETPVEELKPVKSEPQDLCKKRVKKCRSFSRRRHVYRRRSVIEPNTSKAAGKKEDMEIYNIDDDEGEIKIEIKEEPEDGETSGKKIKIDKQEPDDDSVE